MPFRLFKFWLLAPPSPTSPVVIKRVLSGSTNSRLPLWMPAAGRVNKICSFTSDTPFQSNTDKRSVPFQVEPVVYTMKTLGVVSHSGCIAIPSMPGSPLPLLVTDLVRTVDVAPVSGLMRYTVPGRVVTHRKSSGPQRSSHGN